MIQCRRKEIGGIITMKTLKAAESCTCTGSFLYGLKQIGTICFAFLFSVFSTNLLAVTQNPNIPASATSASCDNATLETYSGTSNLQANWEPNQIKLHWYNADTQLDVQDAADSCDYDGGLTVPSTAPTKTGYTFNGWKVKKIFVPEGYTQYEYLTFSGTQYIGTDWTPNQSTEIQAKYKVTATSACWVYGSGSSNPRITAYFSTGASNQRFGAQTIVRQIPANQINEVIQNKEGLRLNGVVTPYPTVANFTSSGKLFIGTAAASSSTAKFKGSIYYMRVYDAGSLRFNLVPAKRNSDNVYGLYDSVSGTFFANLGSGTFSVGPEVTE